MKIAPKLSRRQAVALGAGAAFSTPPLAEAQPVAPEPDLAKTARDANLRNSEAMAKFEVPIATEPAFLFKA